MKSLFSIICLFFLFFSINVSIISFCHAAIPEIERQALIDLYNNTNGSKWDNNTGWLGDIGSECFWYGVICDEAHEHVIEIDFRLNKLEGEVPSSICNFKNLSNLDLGYNQLKSLPEFNNLNNLKQLFLSGNQIKSLPISIGNLVNLTGLYLEKNLLTSLPASIGNLDNLSMLYLSLNQLTSLPESIGNLTKLVFLVLTQNQLTSLPDSIENLNYLNILELGSNQLTSLPDSIGNLSFLTSLTLRNNQLTSVPDSIGNLNFLDLSHNQLTSIPESIFRTNNHFHQLELSSNKFTSLPESIGNLHELNRLGLSDNQLTSLPGSISNLVKLEHLGLSDNHLTSLPESVCELININSLDLHNNQLSSLPESITNLVNLEILDLSDNHLASLPKSTGNLVNLRELYLYNNQLTSLPDSISELVNLTELYLNNNQLTVLPESIGKLVNLYFLYLYNNQLTSLPESISELVNLTELYVSSNQLVSLPESIGKLENLTDLLIFNNQLRSLPENIGKLVNLTGLDLYNNQLASLPASISNLINLTSLALYNNRLTSLPESIGKLINLTSLDLSNNQFSALDESLLNFKYLTDLNLKSNQLSSLPESIFNLKTLSSLDLSNNVLSKLPKNIEKLNNLNYLDLSNNHFDEIPEEILNIESLIYLNLSSNNILHTYVELSSFNSLEELNLANNKICCVSDQLFKITTLKVLDLSKNNSVYDGSNVYNLLPSDIENLSEIKELYLDSIRFSRIPRSLSRLETLNSLSISSINDLESFLILTNLENLRYLSIRCLDNTEPVEIPIELTKLKNLSTIKFDEDCLYYSKSQELNSFILERNPGWKNNPPPLPGGPIIKSISSIGNNIINLKNDFFPITIEFSQPVILKNGTINIEIDAGERNRIVTVENCSNLTKLVFDYSVQKDDFTRHLNISSIQLSNGASLQNQYGEDVDLTLPPGANLADLLSIYVDGTLPEVTINTPSSDCLQELNAIKGQAYDVSRDYTVQLTLKDGNYFYNPENKSWQSDLTWITPEGTHGLYAQKEWKYNTSDIEFSDNTTYTITVYAKDFAGNESYTTTTFTYGTKASKVILESSDFDSYTVGMPLNIRGYVVDLNNQRISGIGGEKIWITGITGITGMNPNYDFEKEIKIKQDGSFETILNCKEIAAAGLWQMRATWQGNSCYQASSSDLLKITSKKAVTSIVIDGRKIAKIKQIIWIFGKVEPELFCENISGIEVQLTFSPPEGSNDDLSIKKSFTDKNGHFVITDIKLNETGIWNITPSISSDAYELLTTKQLQIEVLPSAGYMIIVQGKAYNNEGLYSHYKTSKNVYNISKKRGILEEDIRFFTDINNDTKTDINEDYIESLDKKAINESIIDWAKTKLTEKAGPLYIVLVDHGEKDKFLLGDESITSEELNNWITELEDYMKNNNKNEKMKEIIIILGFCHSGSFIDDLSKENRIIISSSAENEYSYKGPIDKIDTSMFGGPVRDGEFFIAELFKRLGKGDSIADSFSNAVISTEIYTENIKEGDVNAAPYFDLSSQHPLLDDNSDAIGSNNLQIYGGDGEKASSIYLGLEPEQLTNTYLENVHIVKVADTIYLDKNGHSERFPWIILNNTDFVSMWIEIKSPDYIEESSGGQKVLNLPDIPCNLDSKTEFKLHNDTMFRYEWSWDYIKQHVEKDDQFKDLELFEEPGRYQILYFVKDKDTYEVSPIMETNVYRNYTDNAPPGKVEIISPLDNTITSTDGVMWQLSKPDNMVYTWLSWEEVNDPDHHNVHYRICFSLDGDYCADESQMVSNNVIIYETDNTFFPIQIPFDWDLHTVFWKIKAVDQFGLTSSSDSFQLSINNFGNAPFGTYKVSIKNNKIKINRKDITITYINEEGKFAKRKDFDILDDNVVSFGDSNVTKDYYTMNLSVPCFENLVIPITIKEGIIQNNIILKRKHIIDMDNNSITNLFDVIMALNRLSKIIPDSNETNCPVYLNDIFEMMKKILIKENKGLNQ